MSSAVNRTVFCSHLSHIDSHTQRRIQAHRDLDTVGGILKVNFNWNFAMAARKAAATLIEMKQLEG